MKKWSVIVTIILVLTLTACENKDNDNQNATEKHTTSTDTNENQTKTEGKAAYETSSQVSNSENSATAVNSTKGTTINKSAVANKSTTVSQSKAQTVSTTAKPSTTAVPQQVSYTPEAWGTTTDQMETELAEYAQSIGMVYDNNFTLESGHWITPTASDLFNTWNEYKSKLCESIYYYHTVPGYSEVRVIFQYTTTTLRDGSTVKCMDAYIVVK